MRNGNKYGARRVEYGGVVYHSAKEAEYAAQLDIRKRAGEISFWKRQVAVDLYAYDRKICTYRVDFLVFYPGGRKEYVEVKGMQTPQWRLKWKLFCAKISKEMPDVTAIIV